jgi:glycosyltransferase involved in cell wall biosynthesis
VLADLGTIVVDDCSIDDSVTVAESCGGGWHLG